jgi:hypothetical protein
MGAQPITQKKAGNPFTVIFADRINHSKLTSRVISRLQRWPGCRQQL